jgi:hypothetical protein
MWGDLCEILYMYFAEHLFYVRHLIKLYCGKSLQVAPSRAIILTINTLGIHREFTAAHYITSLVREASLER